MPSIKNQHILIIGGSSGIGAGVAKLAATDGVHVSIASSSPTRVEAAVKKLQDAVPGAQIRGYVCDVKDNDVESNLEKLFSDVNTAAGGQLLDHIVYTAARFEFRPLASVSRDYLRDSTQYTYVVPSLIAKLSHKYVKQSTSSSLIFTSGRVADRPMKGGAIGSGVSAAIIGLGRGLALDLAPVRVNVVSPGATNTEMFGSGEQREMLVSGIAKTALLGKVGTPEEVAEAYIYLMKDTNATGSVVRSDGGVLVQPEETIKLFD
ncbi:putative short chain dehydrogenase/ reductase [Hypoxylon trugodes]|uniref:putative short chain dehydrogenase/ reductase n=1 Tax=Hypoxylon trugodes TaxID=326681 RepID=UPI002192CDE9|nr:putative short chain dehydrogenase/ reductase [Hypoxylon trugodes]KAI1387937.1 putative short chain dehydrogenase/ reductase [Hypoxylon trugodes]